MDKRRRNIVKNHEWWWRDMYDEDGEIGIIYSFRKIS